MSSSTKNAKPAVKKQSWFKGLKGQFKSISWPSRKSVVKQTTAVVVISFILGVILTVIDVVIRFGLEFLVK